MGQPIIAASALINPILYTLTDSKYIHLLYYFPLGHTQLETVGH